MSDTAKTLLAYASQINALKKAGFSDAELSIRYRMKYCRMLARVLLRNEA